MPTQTKASNSKENFVLCELTLRPCLLPHAKEVWGKVAFSHPCVILFTGGGLHPGGLLPRGPCIPRGGDSASRGVCIRGHWADPHFGILRHTVKERAVPVLLKCILVFVYVCLNDLITLIWSLNMNPKFIRLKIPGKTNFSNFFR